MGQNGDIKIADLVLFPYISFIIAFTALECQESIYRVHIATQIYPLPPPPNYGSNWAYKIADFLSLSYISFIIAFTALEWIPYIPT